MVGIEIRNRSARIKVLQNQLDEMLNLERAAPYCPQGSTGLVTKDYRGQKAQKEIWKFDAPLSRQFLHILKQAAIELGDGNEKREPNGGEVAPPRVNVFVHPPPRSITSWTANARLVTVARVTKSLTGAAALGA